MCIGNLKQVFEIKNSNYDHEEIKSRCWVWITVMHATIHFIKVMFHNKKCDIFIYIYIYIFSLGMELSILP